MLCPGGGCTRYRQEHIGMGGVSQVGGVRECEAVRVGGASSLEGEEGSRGTLPWGPAAV